MGNATSVYNLVRNVGSSVGIATVATVLARSGIRNRALLGERYDAYGDAPRATLDSYREFLLTQGLSESAAADGAIQAVSRLVEEQAQMLSFIDSFEFMALIFVILAPLILIMRRPSV